MYRMDVTEPMYPTESMEERVELTTTDVLIVNRRCNKDDTDVKK